MQVVLRRKVVSRQRQTHTSVWPIDHEAGRPPDGWSGWPEQKQFALVLTHDVETAKGYERCFELMRLEKELGFLSSFNFVSERYEVSPELRNSMKNQGFEVGVHGLCHDGKLYRSRRVFESRAIRINQYLREWNAVGFRSPAMHHVLDWIHNLNIEYDASTFDTDPFEPQSDGVGTIFPFYVKGNGNRRGYVELPYTLPQDFTLFVLMKERSINIWMTKLNWIVANGGMALVNTHPDYMYFGKGEQTMEEYPVNFYIKLLKYIKSKYQGRYWHILPRDMARFWSKSRGHK